MVMLYWGFTWKRGRVWLMAFVLKTKVSVNSSTVGSNPTASAGNGFCSSRLFEDLIEGCAEAGPFNIRSIMYPEFDCIDCSVSTFQSEYYMVHNHLWHRAGMGANDGMLCILCLESRLGRLLTEHDFTPAPVNYMFFAKNSDRFPNGLVHWENMED